VSDSGEVTAGASQMNSTLHDQFTMRRQLHSTMNDLARLTREDAFYGTNDFAGGLQRSPC
jgi:hypothetical protein